VRSESGISEVMLKEQRFSLHYWEICNLQQSFHYLVVLAVIHVHRLGQHPVHGAICSVRVSTDWPSTFHVFFFFTKLSSSLFLGIVMNRKNCYVKHL